MTALRKPRPLISAAALFSATFFLASAVPHVVSPATASASHRSEFDLLRAEVRLCEAAGDRTHDECIDEVEAKALIRHAEQVAASGAGSDDGLASAAPPVRSRLQ